MNKICFGIMFTLLLIGVLMLPLSRFPVKATDGEAKVFVDPKDNIYYTYQKGVNDTFQINVTIANMTGIAGFQFEIHWNSSLLNGVSMEEVLFDSVTPSGEKGNIWQLTHEVTAGYAGYAYTWLNLTRAIEKGYAPINITTAEGYPEGKLAAAIITLNITAEPPSTEFFECALEITVSKPADTAVKPISHTVEDGYYSIRSLGYIMAIYSLPTGITFAVDGAPHTTPWSEAYGEGASVSLEMPEIHTVGEAKYYWFQWSDGNTSRIRTFTMTANITLTANYTGPYFELTVTSSPVTGIAFTLNGTPQTTPYTQWLFEGSYTLEMPETHDGYVWSHWLEDGDSNRTKTVTLPGTTWTGVFQPAVDLIPDIAVTSVNPFKTVVGQGYSVPVNVTVENQGNATVTFNVTLYANTTVVETQTIPNMPNGTSTILSFAWNTTGWPNGNYSIRAYAEPVPDETDTADNMLFDGWIVVTIPGDVNGDGIVDIFDAIRLAVAYGSTPSGLNWNPDADINGDNIVDIYDAIILAGNYGEKWT